MVQPFCPLFNPVFHLYTRCSAQKESTKKTNIKRENKAYSYKDQIFELEFQEVKFTNHHQCSLEAMAGLNILLICLHLYRSKRRKRASKMRCSFPANRRKWCKSSLTGRALFARDFKGYATKSEVKIEMMSLMPGAQLSNCVFLLARGSPFCHQLDVELQSVMGLLEAALIERPAQITKELPAVLQFLLPLLQSPLAAPRVELLFLDIGVCLMPKHLHHIGTRPVFDCIDKHRTVLVSQVNFNRLHFPFQLCLWVMWLYDCWSRSVIWTRPGRRRTWTQQPTGLSYCCTTRLSCRERARMVSTDT